MVRDVSLSILKENKNREELCKVGKTLRNEGHVEYILGTISQRNYDGVTYITKPQDVDYISIEPEKLVRVNLAGDPLERDKARPSLNWLVHKACYEAGLEIGGVVHAHPQHIVSLVSQINDRFDDLNEVFGIELSFRGKFLAIPIITEEAIWSLNPSESVKPAIPIMEDIDPQGLAKAASKFIPHYNAFVIRNHGIMAVGRNATEALGIVLVLIKEAAVFLDIYKSHGEPILRQKEKVCESISNMPPHFRWRQYNKPADQISMLY